MSLFSFADLLITNGAMGKVLFKWSVERKGLSEVCPERIFFIACHRRFTSRFLIRSKFNLPVCQGATITIIFSWLKKWEKRSRISL